MKPRLVGALLGALLLPTAALEAHEVRPGYLGIEETAPETFEVLWKVPMRGELRLSLDPVFPETCRPATPVARYPASGAVVERTTLICVDGLVGKTLSIAGLEATFTDVLLRYEPKDGPAQTARLKPTAASFIVAAEPSRLEIAGTYLVLGVEHILGGIDHLLFVLALLMLVRGRRRLVWTITAFTVSHSITLALATLGVMHVPSAPVEAVIALSILFLASEIAHSRRGRSSLTERQPWLVAFAFGLLHGFGFAGALSEVGLPESAIPSPCFCSTSASSSASYSSSPRR